MYFHKHIFAVRKKTSITSGKTYEKSGITIVKGTETSLYPFMTVF